MMCDYNVVLVTYADGYEPGVYQFPEMRYEKDMADKWAPMLHEELETEALDVDKLTCTTGDGEAVFYAPDGKEYARATVVSMMKFTAWE